MKRDFITIGWSRAAKILNGEDWHKFREVVHKNYYAEDKGYRCSGHAAGYQWQFLREMKLGHWVVVPHWSGFYVCEVATKFVSKQRLSTCVSELEKVRCNGDRVMCSKWDRDECLRRQQAFRLNTYGRQSSPQIGGRERGLPITPAAHHAQARPECVWICRAR